MTLKSIISKNWQHVVVLIVFIILTFAYFTPQFEGYQIKQHDIEQHKAMSQEIAMFREMFNSEPLWTNSMFGGMPASQISVLYSGNIFQSAIILFMKFWGSGAGIFLLHLLGFYIMALCLRIKPMVALIGAIAFGFATYEIVIIQAGHNSKATAVALLAPVLGAFLMAYRTNWKWGALLSAFFMSFELASNHLQVTYYFAFLLLALGIFEFFIAIKNKSLKQFTITSGSIIVGYTIALLINYGNISGTKDYAQNTIRGGNDLTITPTGDAIKNTSNGLDKEYITNWSYGVGESFTLVSPYVKGSASVGISQSKFKDAVVDSDRTSEEINEILNSQFPLYWGEQPMTSGPVYLGVVMIFIMLLGLYFLKDQRKWILFGIAILALMLSWGKNFAGLTDFFIDYIPGYNKFRTVTIILILTELIVPVIAILFLNELMKNVEQIKLAKKPFIVISASFILVLASVKLIGLGDGYSSMRERDQIENVPNQIMNQILSMQPDQLVANKIDINNKAQIEQIIKQQTENYESQFSLFKKARKDIFNSSMNRSILFAIAVIALFGAFFYMNLSLKILMPILAVLVLADFIPVNQNYLSAEEDTDGSLKYWRTSEENQYPISATPADFQILNQESQNKSLNNAINSGKTTGEQKANNLGYTGTIKDRIVDSYKFSSLNFASNYRVFNYDNPWGSARESYFHKNLGGYHGAKLTSIQNLFEFHLSKSNNKVFDMMNVKYFLQGDNARLNPTALGPVWFVKKIKLVPDANTEILSLGGIYKIKNSGPGKLLINNLEKSESQIYGSETLEYVVGSDTIAIRLSNGIKEGMEVAFVRDSNGRTNFVPKSVLNSDITNSFQPLANVILVDDFIPKDEAIMQSNLKKGPRNTSFSGEGEIKMNSCLPNKIVYTSSSKSNQFAVFSEIYYKDGWSAKIDNKEVDILKVNYLLRGLEIPAGKHIIQFEYKIPKFEFFNKISLFLTFFILIVMSYLLYLDNRKMKLS